MTYMTFPKIETCIICEGVRQERYNKHIILGYYGIAPHVTVILGSVREPATICFIFAGGSDDDSGGKYDVTLQIRNPTGMVISTPSNLPQIKGAVLKSGDMPANVFFTFQGVFGMEGIFSLDLSVNGVNHYHTRLGVRQGDLSKVN
jgi:hypothetical protein